MSNTFRAPYPEPFAEKLIEKSRECYNHKPQHPPQPTADTKRKRKRTELTLQNKQTNAELYLQKCVTVFTVHEPSDPRKALLGKFREYCLPLWRDHSVKLSSQISYILRKRIYYGYSLWITRRGDFDESPRHMSRLMIKLTKWLCAQRRLRSAWASAQSDQSLRCALNRWLRTQAFFMRTAKTLIRLGGRLIWVFAGRTDNFVGFVTGRLITEKYEKEINSTICDNPNYLKVYL